MSLYLATAYFHFKAKKRNTCNLYHLQVFLLNLPYFCLNLNSKNNKSIHHYFLCVMKNQKFFTCFVFFSRNCYKILILWKSEENEKDDSKIMSLCRSFHFSYGLHYLNKSFKPLSIACCTCF